MLRESDAEAWGRGENQRSEMNGKFRKKTAILLTGRGKKGYKKV